MKSFPAALLAAWLILVFIINLFFVSSHQQCIAEPVTNQTAKNHRSITVPFTPLRSDASYRPHQLITVNIQKDGSSPEISATFLFDTGANASFISSSLAHRLGLPQYPIIERDGTPGNLAGQSILGIQVAAVEIGDLRINGFRFQILPDQRLPVNADQALDGALGTDFLSFCAAHIDFAQSQITFIVPSVPLLSYDTLDKNTVILSSEEIFQQGFGKSMAIPLNAANGSFFATAVLSSGSYAATEHLLIDSGAASTFLSKYTAQELNLKTVSAHDSTGVLGHFTGDQAWLSSLVCGNLDLNNLLVFSASDPKMKGFATLGLDVLANYDVLLDFPHLKMYLNPRTDLRSVTLRQYQAASPSQRRQWAHNPLYMMYPTSTPDFGNAIPYELAHNGLPSAQVRLNRTTPQLPFLLKSNTNNITISEILAQLWHLSLETPLDDANEPRLLDGFPIYLAKLPCLQIGGALVNGQVAVLPVRALTAFTSNLPFSGVVGANFLFMHPLLMDPATQTWIALTALHPEDLPSLDMADAVIVDILDPDGDGIPAVSVQAQQGTAQFTETSTLATGSPFTLLSAQAAKTLNLTPNPQKLTYGAGKDITVFNQAHLSQISIGGVVLKNVLVAYPMGAMPDGFYPRLGMNVISKLRLLVDAPAKKMYVKIAAK